MKMRLAGTGPITLGPNGYQRKLLFRDERGILINCLIHWIAEEKRWRMFRMRDWDHPPVMACLLR